ncbi:unnamed protein product [Ilex paraguariensis]|uniref:Uncharacterized protein n=1 Tax=Ilex paraguariensis TaxID=185542 RepID=A0ABC8RLX3_9AQUA
MFYGTTTFSLTIPNAKNPLFVYIEEMIRGLTQVPWERVDVSFQKSRQRYVAHNTIQASSCTGLFTCCV